MRKGPRKKACFQACKARAPVCRAECKAQAKRKRQQKKGEDVEVLLGGKNEPSMSLDEATEIVNDGNNDAISAVPPNIDDITSILDEQKVADPKLAKKQQADAIAVAVCSEYGCHYPDRPTFYLLWQACSYGYAGDLFGPYHRCPSKIRSHLVRRDCRSGRCRARESLAEVHLRFREMFSWAIQGNVPVVPSTS